ncbi:MAG: NTP transferase domain-containing protein [Betaproteobacteria bacterium]|nr:NTP transferase domain-containing protein [Betaproteobacteria bacterium]
MVLAAGRGERMRPLTDTCPKPLLQAGGKPLIVWQLERLAAAGCRDVIVNLAHLGALVEEALGDGSTWGLGIRYSREAEALESAGGIALALPSLGHEPFIVINGDVYCDLDLAHLNDAYERLSREPDTLAHLVLVDNPPHHPDGDFGLSGGRPDPDLAPKLTFSGIGVYRPELFRSVVPGRKAKLAPLLVEAMRARSVTAEHYRGFWMDVGTPQRLHDLDRHIRPVARTVEDSR